MAQFNEVGEDFNETIKNADEINQHVDYIKSVVDMWIRYTPANNVMLKVFSEVNNRLDKIKSLNDNLYHHNEVSRDDQHHNK